MNRVLGILVISLVSSTVFAKDFGRYGVVFQIQEEGFVAMIKNRLRNLDLDQHQKQMQQLSKERIETPKIVDSISRVKETNIFFYDPTYTLDREVKLPDGKILYPAGTKVNPFDHISWDERLVFIDGRDSDQVSWLETNFSNKKFEKLKIILVAGRPFDLEKDLDQKIYFDQQGTLTKKFGIKQVPAIVEQDSKMIKITETIEKVSV